MAINESSPKQGLQKEAKEAARAGHLEAQVRVRGHAATAIPLWDELRIWDPGD